MLTNLRIQNFKAWKDTGDVRFAPLTVLFGRNSAGKSSLGHLLLALKQTAAAADRHRALDTGDETSLIDLGSFVEALHGRDREARLEVTLDWRLPQPLAIANPLDEGQAFAGDHLRLTSALVASAQDQPVVRELRYALRREDFDVVSARLTHPVDGEVQLEVEPYRLVRAENRTWPLDPPEKFYRISDRSLARYRNADFVADFALEVERNLAGLAYLGPLREAPRRTYGWAGNTPANVGARGEYAIACLLAADAARRTFERGDGTPSSFAELVAGWLVELGVIESFALRPVAPGRRDYELKVKTLGGLVEVGLPDVGFGVSQVLPALVQAFYAPPGAMVWMEQPELHLHPQVQSTLADVFIAAIRAREGGRPRDVQVVIETHSEHLLERLQRRIAEGALRPEEVAIYFAKAGQHGAELEELTVNELGDITNWPEDFFGDEMGDLVARTEAAARARGAQRP
jgi:predicted ATPase